MRGEGGRVVVVVVGGRVVEVVKEAEAAVLDATQ